LTKQIPATLYFCCPPQPIVTVTVLARDASSDAADDGSLDANGD
jgi:hypothetical protein